MLTQNIVLFNIRFFYLNKTIFMRFTIYLMQIILNIHFVLFYSIFIYFFFYFFVLSFNLGVSHVITFNLKWFLCFYLFMCLDSLMQFSFSTYIKRWSVFCNFFPTHLLDFHLGYTYFWDFWICFENFKFTHYPEEN